MATKITGFGAGGFGSKAFGGSVKKKADPLAAVLKSNAKSRADLAALGQADPTAKPDPSALDRIFGVLDTPGAGIRALAHNLVNKPTDADVNPLDEMGKALRGEQRVEGADILGDLGVSNKWGKMLGGMAIDILLDPVTYITAGIGGAGKSATTSTLAKLAAGTETLDNVLDAAKVAKYADILDESGHIADAANVSKEVAASLYDDVAKALGYKGGIKFMGAEVLPTNGNEVGRTVKTLLRGQNEAVPQAVNDALKPLSTWFEQGFVHDELTPIYREGNEFVKAFTTIATRDRNAGLHVADQAAEALQRKLESVIPDERTRMLVSKGIGRQFGDTGNMAKFAAAFEAGDTEAISALRASLFDPDAIRRTLEEAGIVGQELEDAVVGAQFAQDTFAGLLDSKRAVGLEATSRYGAGVGGEAAGYVPGRDLYRGSNKEAKTAAALMDDVFGQADVVAPDHAESFMNRLNRPSTEHSKVYANTEMRRAGLTMDDLAAGATEGSAQGLRTEGDIAQLLGGKARKDLRDVAYKKYVDDITGVLGTDPDLIATLEKSKAIFTNDDATRGFLKASDKALNVWRKWATIYNFPMFPARNWLSNKFLLSTEGILDPVAIGDALKIATASEDDLAKMALTYGGRTQTGAEWLAEAQSKRVYVGAPETLQMVGKQAQGKSLIGKLEHFAGDVNQRFVEDADRLSGYFAALNKGLDPDAAAMMVDRALYSYAPEALTVFERNIMRRVTPFYTFMRRNTPHMIELLGTKPGSLTWISHAKESGEAATGIDTNILPDYTKNLFSVPLPTSDKNPMLLSTSGILPIGDLERILPLQNPKEFAREQLSSLNPFVRDLIIEFPLNQDIYRNGKIETFVGAKTKLPASVQAFDGAVKGIPVLGDLWAKAKSQLGIISTTNASGATSLVGNAYANKAIADFLPWMKSVDRLVQEDKSGLITQLSGVKMIPYDAESFTTQKAYDDRATLTDILARLKGEGKVAPKKSSKKSDPLTKLLGGGK